MPAQPLLSGLNHPTQHLQGPNLLYQLIDWEENHDRCAIDFTFEKERRLYSYGELKLCTDALSMKLRSATTAQDPRAHIIVPIFLPQCPALYVSQIAILRSGAAFCPINLDTPSDRLRFIVQDVSATVVITTSKLQHLFSWSDGPELILVDQFPTPVEQSGKVLQDVATQPSSPAYIMYTSGSSGQPKGVIVSHRAVTQSLLAHQKHVPSFQRFLQFAAPSFDVSVFEIFFPLVRGTTLVGCDRSQLLNDLAGTMVRLEVDAAELTPTVAGSLLQKRSNAPCLKLLLTIGEMLTTPIIHEFGGSEEKKSMLYGMYGPTEAAIHCNINPAMSVAASPRNIGIPLMTVSNFVVAPSQESSSAQLLEFLPQGEVGELLLGGPQLADEYLNRPDQNKAAFIWNENELYYRTGDQARILENGTVELFGRINSGQVKIRGQRVELGEIEEAIYKQPGVKGVSVAVLNGVILAFVLLHDSQIAVEHILETCSKWLPKFMVPGEILVLPHFPYLPSGKVDKRTLASDYEQGRTMSETQRDDVLSDTEKNLRTVLTNTLGYFNPALRLPAAGIDSLMAIRISACLRKQGYNVSTLAVLECETYEALVAACNTQHVASDMEAEAENRPAKIENGPFSDEETILQCTPLQNSLIAETLSHANAYQNWVELEITLSHSYDHVVESFLRLTKHNPILRAQFHSSANSPGHQQIIRSNFPISLIKRVDCFNYDTLTSDDILQNPVRLQIISSSNLRLLLFLHHAIYDAWSLELLLDDFTDILLSSNPVNRPDIGLFIRSASDGTLIANTAQSQQYWRDHLDDLASEKLPNFLSKKTTLDGMAVVKHRTQLGTDNLQKAAHGLQVSPQSLFQAAYSILLSVYLGSTDVCFGTVFSGRTLPITDIERLAFPCLSTLPVRIDTTSSNSLQDLVTELNSINRKHLPHSSMSLREVKQAAGIPPGQALFDTLFVWQQTLHDFDHKREALKIVDALDNLEFTVTLEVIPTKDNIELRANYQQALVPDAQIRLFLQQLEYITSIIVNDSSLPVADVFRNCPSELLSAENTRPHATYSKSTLASPVETIAEEDGARLAIQFATSIDEDSSDIQSLSYQELNARSNRIAHLLSQRGVVRDELVCIFMEKCLDLHCTILAVTKLGAGYLPIVPDTPLDRIKHIIREANVRNVVLHSASRAISGTLETYNLIDLDLTDLSTFSAENLVCQMNLSAASYCIYTSGSTGTPKGVVVTQGNLLSNLDMLQEMYPTSKHTRLLQSCSQAFDVSVFEIFFTWRIGGCLCSATKDILFSDIERSIRALQITHLSLTPTVAALIDPINVPSVEFLVTAGEAVTEKVFNLWAGRGLYQGYGPSETTNICTVNPRVVSDDFINNIGKPFSNTSSFVLQPGPDFELVPRGGVGEFCFGGSQIFRGYLNPEQDVGKIIDHPEYGRLYRSGDYGRLMSDGSLAFTGRKDDQVKIRGQRVELGEINNVVIRSLQVSDCVTMIIDGVNGRQSLVCFWTARKSEISEDLKLLEPNSTMLVELFAQLQAALPAYMVPTSLIPVTYLPSTSQGKIDKRLLISMFKDAESSYLSLCSSTTSDGDIDHEWTELERQIATNVAETTGVQAELISPDASFFAFGIDSISAIGLAKKLTAATHRKIEISDVLKNPTVRTLAKRTATKSETYVNGVSQKVDFDFGIADTFVVTTTKRFEDAGQHLKRILPCTPLQIAMLSASDISIKSTYENHVTFAVQGDLPRLQECWHAMVKRHDILRTCFISTDMADHPYVQIVLGAQSYSSPTTEDHKERPVPPYSVKFAETDKGAKMKLSMHHALYDGVALDILYREIEHVYRREQLQPAVDFGDFLEYVSNAEREKGLDSFWTSILGEVRPSRLQLVDSTRSAQPRIKKLQISLSLPAIDAAIKKHSTTLLAVCHAVWTSILSTLVQDVEVCFGNVVGGRGVPVDGVDRLVAPCFNTLPLRMSNVHKKTYLEAFRTFQSLNADMLPYQFTPLRRLQQNFSSDGGRLFDTLVILQQPGYELDSSIWEIEEDDGMMDFPLVIEVVPKKGQEVLEVMLHSHFSQVAGMNPDELLQEFERIFISALEDPRRQMMSLQQRQAILNKTPHKLYKRSVSSEQIVAVDDFTPEEEQIRKAFAHFTDVPIDQIGKDTTIFRLGLDSISTVQVATKLRKEGYNVLGSDILENPSISQIAKFLANKNNDNREMPTFDLAAFDKLHRERICTQSEIDPETVEAVRPCTAVQSGMLAQTLHSNGLDYVNSIWLKLDEDITSETFKHSWRQIIDQHEMLRTGFVQLDGGESPFAMITYHDSCFVPIFLEHGQPCLLDSKQLIRQPWNICFDNDKDNVVVRFQAHHAVYDAQSLQHILSDMANVCAGYETISRPPIAPVLGTLLGDSKLNLQNKQDFWQNETNKIIVNRFPDLTPLRVYDATNEVSQFISKSTTSYLERRCKDLGVTMQAVTQAAWAKILAAYTGEISSTFGMTLSGRGAAENSENVSFPTIVTLPVRCEVVGTNQELLRRTVSANAALHKHQFTPLTLIQKWAGYSDGRIFDTLFAYQKTAGNNTMEKMPWTIVKEEANIDYAVSMEVSPELSDDLTLRLTFKTNLIPIEHADLLLKQYDAILHDLLEDPEAPCDVMPEFDADLLSITPAKQPVLSGPVTLLHDFVTRGAQVWADNVALEFATSLEPGGFQSRKWTYQELDRESNRVANLLVEEKILPGELVGICFDKCPEASFAIVGIMKAGCAYVALDPSAPIDRLQYIVQDSAANLVLSAGAAAEKIEGPLDTKVIDLSTLDMHRYSSGPPELNCILDPSMTSYCLYTSGTTGTPKGCLISHDNAVQAMYSFSLLFDGHWSSDSKWLQFASFHFDVSVLEQFWSWSVGICMASAPRDLIFEDIPEAIRQLGITHIDLTPSLARLVHPDDVPSLTEGVFITGGEPLKQEILDAWGKHACIYNGYGPTEATIGCTMYTRVPQNGNPSNIGPAWENAGSYVLKPGTDVPVLRGGVGELCVSGKLVGIGYLNRPELTAERFPTLQPFNERVYRTGDLVRILSNGTFIFLGRADDQVKLRGQRLELGEINEVMKKSTDDVDEVVTLVLKHDKQQKEQLVTFFVIKDSAVGKDITDIKSDLRRACTSKLPGYMVPTYFVPLKNMPLNANHKADVKQLAAGFNELSVEQLQEVSQGRDHRNLPWTPQESKVVVAIEKAINIEDSVVTRSSNIFELGIDSISIIGFARRLQNAGLGNAKLSVVKSNPSVDSLVKALLEGKKNPDGNSEHLSAKQKISAFSQKHLVSVCGTLGVDSADIEAVVPCTPVQEGMIFRFLENDSSLYFNEFQFQLRVGVDALWSAWAQVVQRLQVLRTKFVETDDGYAQVVFYPRGQLRHREKLEVLPIDKHAALRQPFQLAMCVRLVGGTMNLRIFHGLYDGNSLTMLLRCVVGELQKATIDYGPSFHSSLPHGPLAIVEGARSFWQEHLKSWTPATFSPSSAAAADISVSGDIIIEGFEALRRKLGVSHQAIVQAVWLTTLQGLTIPNLTIGVVTSGRAIDFENAEKVIGPLFNTLPFHLPLSSGMTFARLIKTCHDANMKIQDHQHTPLKDIQKWSPAQPGQNLFDTLFVFQRPEQEDEGFADGVWTVVKDAQTADYPLAFETTLSPACCSMRLTIVAQGNYFDENLAQGLLSTFDKRMKTVLKTEGNNQFELDGLNHTGSAILATQQIGNRHVVNDVADAFYSTKDAETIRQQLSILANIPESSIGESMSIFELGLDSIDVIKLSSRLRRNGIRLAVSELIKAQSISRMMQQLSTQTGNRTQPNGTNAKKLNEISDQLQKSFLHSHNFEDVEAVLPATPLQEAMVTEMINSNYESYFNTEVFEIHKGVNVHKLENVLNLVLAKSPILRTTFWQLDDPDSPHTFAQVVYDAKSRHAISLVACEDIDTYGARDDYITSFHNEAVMAANKHNSPLRIRIVRHRCKTYLLLAVSHALYDGTSLRHLHSDIQNAYYGTLQPRPHYSKVLAEAVHSTSPAAKEFWKATLTNAPTTHIPSRQPTIDKAATRRLEKRSIHALRDIETFCRSSKITIQTLGQTCWAVVLSYLAKQVDVIFGAVLSCRDTEEAEAVMFPLMNTVAVRSVMHGSTQELLAYMQAMSDSIRQYQHFPLSKAQAFAFSSTSHTASSNDSKLFNTLFIYQGRRSTTNSYPLYTSIHGTSEVEIPVCVEMEVVDDEHLVWTTACKSTIDVEAEEIINLLETVLDKLLRSQQVQVLTSTTHGVSILGLPSFKIEDEPTASARSIDTNVSKSEEWTDVEINIRVALHQLSHVPIKDIRKDSTIFNLGLDSITVLKMPGLLRRHGIKLRVSDIIKGQNIARIAKLVTTTQREDRPDVDGTLKNALMAINLDSLRGSFENAGNMIEDILPLTSGQLFMLRQWRVSGGSLFYPKFEFVVEEELNIPKLNEAWQFLQRRHSVLRTTFREVDGRHVQLVTKNINDYIVDDSVISTTRDLITLYSPAYLVVSKKFENLYSVKIIMQHTLYDGVSLPLLLDELQQIYRGKENLPPTLNFRDFVARSLYSASRHDMKTQWVHYLETPEILAVNYVSHVDYTHHTDIYRPGNKTADLSRRVRDIGVSIDAFILAANSRCRARILQEKLEGQAIPYVIIGIYHANRAPFGEVFSTMCAPTLNLLPLIIHEPLQRTLEDIARGIQDDLRKLGSDEMSSVSLEQIFEWTGKCVDFWVNILRDASRIGGDDGLTRLFKPIGDVDRTRGEVATSKVNSALQPQAENIYLPSIDVEIRYTSHEEGGILDIGVFAPVELISVEDGKTLVTDLLMELA